MSVKSIRMIQSHYSARSNVKHNASERSMNDVTR